jgi:hypothetical protein
MSNKRTKKTLVVPEILSEDYLQSKEGEYFDEKSYKYIIKEDTDVYGVDSEGNKKLILKFRKNLIPLEYCLTALNHLKKPAMHKMDNRGAAGGVLDPKKLPSYVKELANPGKFRTVGYYNKDGKFINSSLGNMSMSNIVGFYDRADRNLGKGAPKCRLTAFTAKNWDKWEECIPYFQYADACFKVLVPDRHKLQYDRANQTEFVIPGTSFSTVTINYNWRTALHKDDGDFKEGFGNLLVLEEGKYEGGYLGFPRYGVAVDVRMGDFLAMDVHDWHCNTPMKGMTKDFTRLSVVCYLREKMLRCKDTSLQESIERSSQTRLKKAENKLIEKGILEEDVSNDSNESNKLYSRK